MTESESGRSPRTVVVTNITHKHLMRQPVPKIRRRLIRESNPAKEIIRNKYSSVNVKILKDIRKTYQTLFIT